MNKLKTTEEGRPATGKANRLGLLLLAGLALAATQYGEAVWLIDSSGNELGGEQSPLRVNLGSGSGAAFGELYTVEPRPIVQIDAVYGLLDNVETFTDASPGTGTVSATDSMFVATTGVGVGGYGVIRSRRTVRYRPGQGAVFRYTAAFAGTPTALSLQAAGPFNTTNGFVVGYDGTSYGVMHRTGGRHETRTLTVDTQAAGAETLSLTLNSVLYSIPVTAGTVQHNADEIADWLEANQVVWNAYQNNDTVVLFGRNAAALNGTYSDSNGGGNIDVSVVQDKAGAANTETWTTQANFNIDKLDGTGDSGMTIDPAKLNVYETKMQYLGGGNVEMLVENPTTGDFFPFHEFRFAGTRTTTPTLLNPNLKVGWIAASLGSTTDLTVYGSSAMGGIDGPIHNFRRPRAYSYQRASVAGTLTNIFSIRVRSVFNDVVQLSEVLPRLASIAPAGNKECEAKILLNPTFSGATNWQYVDETESIVEYDTTGSTFSATGDEIASLVISGGTSGQVVFRDLAGEDKHPIHLERGDVLTIAARITGGAGNNVTASMTWIED